MEQGGCRLLVLRLEHPPLAEPRAHMLEHELVDLRRDSPDDLAAPLGEEQSRLGMLEPGIGARIDEAVYLGLERRYPVRVVRIEAESEVDERLAIGGVLDGADGEAGGGGCVGHGGFVTTQDWLVEGLNSATPASPPGVSRARNEWWIHSPKKSAASEWPACAAATANRRCWSVG